MYRKNATSSMARHIAGILKEADAVVDERIAYITQKQASSSVPVLAPQLPMMTTQYQMVATKSDAVEMVPMTAIPSAPPPPYQSCQLRQ